MELKFITKTLVYEYSGVAESGWDLGGSQGGWQLANSGTVQEAFRNDPQRLRRFERYLRANYVGLVFVRGGQWICYGWYSHPRSAGPPHLPRWSARLGAHWILGCHTHSSFRQLGFYKQLLVHLTGLIRQRQHTAEIFIDTRADNVASRRAILASGFEPCGVATTYRGWVPLVGSYVLTGKWRRREAHPEMGAGILDVPAAAMSGAASISGGAPWKGPAR